ncbi:hypothetical protein BCR32DRAFT_330841 [Anaeromyces robustus]|uniref:Uncharacterized protein n=1 Tax=Anaeromyces robustus TaxID=1754192 RepID=A0A1Y1VQH5_9FUNG|nr:hypothetical protein BCR32DRAFT_330841 [Anaeromyces robustus]|eukprot:ORX63529.1 hypothetical protein BCR32DRAFT_330841 [Anaeromyces robustus]
MKFSHILLLLSAAALSFAQVSEAEDGAAGADLAAGDDIPSEGENPVVIPDAPPADGAAASNTSLDAVPDVSDAQIPGDTAGLNGANVDASDNGISADAGAEADSGEKSDNDDSAGVNALDDAGVAAANGEPADTGANGENADAGAIGVNADANGENADAGAADDGGEKSNDEDGNDQKTGAIAAGAGLAATACGAGIFFWTKKTKRQGLESLRSQAALV